eukprot:2679466-Rhodomonas_salina.1
MDHTAARADAGLWTSLRTPAVAATVPRVSAATATGRWMSLLTSATGTYCPTRVHSYLITHAGTDITAYAFPDKTRVYLVQPPQGRPDDPLVALLHVVLVGFVAAIPGTDRAFAATRYEFQSANGHIEQPRFLAPYAPRAPITPCS